jgi:GDP-L-fucose synthase
MKTALVTGGCGFIGRHFTKKLTTLGYKVIVVDNLASDSALQPEKWSTHLKCDFEYYKMDILDYLSTHKEKFDIIIHAAAIVGGRAIIENDPFLISRNIHIDNELFRWIEKTQPNHLVYFSSSAVYPIKFQESNTYKKLSLQDVDVSSNNISIPDLTYGWSKLTGEFSLSILSKRVDTCISVYRPFSGYGEDQHSTYPFPSILSKVTSDKEMIDIWSDGVRDFVYIDDIVDYVLSSCFHSEHLKVMNIGTGVPTSMSKLANTMMNILGIKEKPIQIVDDKPKGVHYRVCEDNIDFRWTSIEEGIKKCYDSIEYELCHTGKCSSSDWKRRTCHPMCRSNI